MYVSPYDLQVSETLYSREDTENYVVLYKENKDLKLL